MNVTDMSTNSNQFGGVGYSLMELHFLMKIDVQYIPAWSSNNAWPYDWDEYCVGSEVYLPMQESIKAHYPFDGNANDLSGNGYDGELFGQITLTTDRHGNEESAYHFDGSNGTSIVVSDNIPLANSSHTIIYISSLILRLISEETFIRSWYNWLPIMICIRDLMVVKIFSMLFGAMTML